MSLSVKVKRLENDIDYIAYIVLEDGSKWHPIQAFYGTNRQELYRLAFEAIDKIQSEMLYGM